MVLRDTYTAVPDMELVPLLSFLSLWVGCTSAQELRPGPGVVNVPEGDDAVLPCALGSGQSVEEFDWRKDNGIEAKKEVFMYNRGSYYGDGKTKGQSPEFTNRVEFFERERKSGNASIIIKNTRLEDNGTYTCGLGLFRDNRQEVHIRLNVGGVLKKRNVTGAAPVPYVKSIREKNTWSLLECKVSGIPKPELEWKNSDKKTLLDKEATVNQDTSARFHVKLQVNVTKSDNYTCVVTQRDIYHQINNTMEVHLQDEVAESPIGWIVAVGFLVVVVVALLLIIIHLRFQKGPIQPEQEATALKSTSTGI